MQNFNHVTLVEIIEEWAENNNLAYRHIVTVESEARLSQLFDENIAPAVIAKYGADDEIAINEAFNNWADGLVEEGTLHPEQLNTYDYVGEYS